MWVGRKGLAGGGIGAIILALVALYFGVDPAVVLNQAGNPVPTQEEQTVAFSPEEERLKEFMSVVLADTEDVWGALFQGSGQRYSPPKLVLFSGAVESACGFAEAAMGPFYCPTDQKLYLDMRFFNDLAQRHGAPGDFAQAYVVAHEVGHHVQTLLGISEQVHAARQQAGKRGQRVAGADGAAGRLFCRGVGAPRPQGAAGAGAGRRRGSPGSGDRRGRRPPAEAGAWGRGAGFLHPRLVGAADALVQPRPAKRRSGAVRHLQGRKIGTSSQKLRLENTSVGRQVPNHAHQAGGNQGQDQGAAHTRLSKHSNGVLQSNASMQDPFS